MSVTFSCQAKHFAFGIELAAKAETLMARIKEVIDHEAKLKILIQNNYQDIQYFKMTEPFQDFLSNLSPTGREKFNAFFLELSPRHLVSQSEKTEGGNGA